MSVAAVVIGRNEGERLKKGLMALRRQIDRIIYVDSGSTDGSADYARGLGLEVVELSTDQPFTAARGRNAGFDVLKQDPPEFIQFLDGDCQIQTGWVKHAVTLLRKRSDVALVTGWGAEVTPDTSVYHQMSHDEWRRPAGEIDACPGNFMIRSRVWNDVGGMRPDIIAAEDDDFLIRVRASGWLLMRLPIEKYTHDLGNADFRLWWRRAERTGHGFAQVGAHHPDYFVRERRRSWVWGLILPVLILLALSFSTLFALGLLSLYGISWYRTSKGVQAAGRPWSEAAHHGAFLTLSKFPNLIGMIRFYIRQMAGRSMRLIEYK